MADSCRSKRGIVPPNFVPCSSCKRIKPRPTQDLHDLCPRCRPCNRGNPCNVCRDWIPTEWESVEEWLRSRSPSGDSSASTSSRRSRRCQPAQPPESRSQATGRTETSGPTTPSEAIPRRSLASGKVNSSELATLSGDIPRRSLCSGKATFQTTRSVPGGPAEPTLVPGNVESHNTAPPPTGKKRTSKGKKATGPRAISTGKAGPDGSGPRKGAAPEPPADSGGLAQPVRTSQCGLRSPGSSPSPVRSGVSGATGQSRGLTGDKSPRSYRSPVDRSPLVRSVATTPNYGSPHRGLQHLPKPYRGGHCFRKGEPY